jgi:broad specificity phosphatase PhoE
MFILTSNIYFTTLFRAWETAEIVQHYLRIREKVNVAIPLRERDFGKFDGKENVHYDDVWRNDRVHPHSSINGEER